MKTIGLIGGMSWESTVTYYQIINETIKEQLGGLHSAKIILYSVEFSEIEEYQSRGEWDKAALVLTDVAKKLEQAGAEFILICTNTMHKVAPNIQREISIPILHIGDATAEQLEKHDMKKVALLGTKYTMTQDFLKERIQEKGIDVLIPDAKEIELINRIIFDELCLGQIKDSSRNEYVRIMNDLKEQGAQGVILGCAEIVLLIKQEDSPLPIYDTAEIHALAAAKKALEEES